MDDCLIVRWKNMDGQMFKYFNDMFKRLTAIEEKLGIQTASLSLEPESEAMESSADEVAN